MKTLEYSVFRLLRSSREERLKYAVWVKGNGMLDVQYLGKQNNARKPKVIRHLPSKNMNDFLTKESGGFTVFQEWDDDILSEILALVKQTLKLDETVKFKYKTAPLAQKMVIKTPCDFMPNGVQENVIVKCLARQEYVDITKLGGSKITPIYYLQYSLSERIVLKCVRDKSSQHVFVDKNHEDNLRKSV